MPKDREKFYFKLRQGVQKKVVVSVQQMCHKELGIERFESLLCDLVKNSHFDPYFIVVLGNQAPFRVGTVITSLGCLEII